MKAFWTILLLIVSNSFMTMAWSGHLKLSQTKWGAGLPLVAIILISWGIALMEYCCQVPANRIGYIGNGGPFTLVQLKVIQEVISLTVFTVFTLAVFRTEQFGTNHVIGFCLLILAVYFLSSGK